MDLYKINDFFTSENIYLINKIENTSLQKQIYSFLNPETTQQIIIQTLIKTTKQKPCGLPKNRTNTT